MAANFTPTLAPLGVKRSTGVDQIRFSWQDPSQRAAWIAAMASAAVLVWSYWLMFVDAAELWDQPQYSHGWILPLIAVAMMWMLRPNKSTDPAVERALQAIGAVSIGLVVLAEWVAALRGVGLAVACLGGFGCALWGQPFAKFGGADRHGLTRNGPAPLWAVTAGGAVATLVGLFAGGVLPINSDVLSMAGLLTIALGCVLVACFELPSTVITWHEVAAGLVAILVCCVSWWVGVWYDRMPLAEAAFIATAIGVLLIVGGVQLVRWAGPPVVFLIFMFPLPALVERNVLGHLQSIAVRLSEMAYTIMGVAAIKEGNQITLPGLNDDIKMEVAAACSGLSMTNILFAMCVALAILTTRPWWDRLIILLSALPIAILSNVFRIVVTGFIWMAMDHFAAGDPEFLQRLRNPIHNWIGLIVMMPFALGLLTLEVKLLSMLSVPEDNSLDKSHVMGRGSAPPGGVPAN